MKKFLSVLLAVLMIFSCTAVMAFAEDVSEPGTEPAEPTVEPNHYDFCQDPDFINVVYLSKGNDAATIVYPGDIISTYTGDPRLNIKYYPDVDGQYRGDWVPAAPNNLAFSLSGQEAFTELFPRKVQTGTVRGIDDPDFPMDFTIAYSDENTFVGWVVLSYDNTTNTVTLCGLWNKTHNPPEPDETEDLYYIIDFFYTLRQKIASPFFRAIKWLSNAILFVKTWLYNLIFGAKAA